MIITVVSTGIICDEGEEIHVLQIGQSNLNPFFVGGKKVRVPDMEWSDSLKKWILKEKPLPNEVEVWPIDPKNEERIWRVNPDGARREIAEGEISIIEKAGRARDL